MFNNPFSFKGRIRRTEFALSYILFLVFIYSVSSLVIEVYIDNYSAILIFFACYWFLFSQGSKRCHDLGYNGFYQIIPFYVIVLIFNDGQRRTNKYGPDPKLVELQNKELVTGHKSTSILLPKEKNLKLIGSELLSITMVATLIIQAFREAISNFLEVSFIIESLLVMGSYYLLLLVSHTRKSLPDTPRYFMLHRILFSTLIYLFLWLYNYFFKHTATINYDAWFNEILFLLSLFTLTYLPYLFYKKNNYAKA